MSQSQSQFLGEGYSCKLVNQPKELQTECSVCLQLLRAPEMVSCCGNKFCQPCISHVLSKSNRCPLRGQTNITTMADRQLARTLNSLEIHCAHYEEGCPWTGEMRMLEGHLNQQRGKPGPDWLKGCSYVTVKCKHCHRKYQRREVEYHMTVCPEARIPCQYREFGCKVILTRKKMTDHLASNVKQHSFLFESYAKKLNIIRQHDLAFERFSRKSGGGEKST